MVNLFEFDLKTELRLKAKDCLFIQNTLYPHYPQEGMWIK